MIPEPNCKYSAIAFGAAPDARTCIFFSLDIISEHAELAPAPLSIDPLAPHLRLPCGAVPPLLERAVMAAAAAMLSLERPSLSSSAPVLCLLITRHWLGSSTRCTLLLCVCGRIGFTLATCRHIVVSPSDALARALTLDDYCCHGLVLLLWEAEHGGCGPLVTWEMVVALVSSRL